MNSRARLRAEDGASLLLAIAFLAGITLLVTALLSFSEVGFKVTGGAKNHRADVYAADGAVEAAIQHVSNDPDLGKDPFWFPGSTCPDTTLTTNDRDVTVTCTPRRASGVPAFNPENTPEQSVLALGTNDGDGFHVDAPQPVPIHLRGDVRVNKVLRLSNKAQIGVAGYVDARACDRGPATSLRDWRDPDPPNCFYNENWTDPNDPGNNADDFLAEDISGLPIHRTVPTCSGSGETEVEAGIYLDAGVLSALTNGSCSDRLVFDGAYYFHTGSWVIQGGAARTEVQAGTPADFDEHGNATGCDRPTQFIFGGDSRLEIKGNPRVSFCHAPAGDGQWVSIYAKKPVSPPVSDSETFEATQSSSTTLIPHVNARSIDGNVAEATLLSEQSASLTLSDFEWPHGPAVVTSAKLVVSHRQEKAADITNANVAITPGNDGAPFSVGVPTSGSLTPSQIIDISHKITNSADIDDLALTYEITAKKMNSPGGKGPPPPPPTVDVDVDGIVLEIDYTLLQPDSQEGCTAQAGVASPTCPLLDVRQNPGPGIFGTVYAPDSRITASSVNHGEPVFRRGVIGWTIHYGFSAASGGEDLPPFQIPGHVDGLVNRRADFVATIGSSQRLRARVEFDNKNKQVFTQRWVAVRPN